MKFLIKLTVLAVALGAIVSVTMPETPVGEVVNAAIEDVSGFCDRNTEACDQGAALAYRTTDLIAAALTALQSETGTSTLTQTDKSLAPPAQPVAAQETQPAIATHGALPKP
ncbi:MAG: hypothetical protein AAGF49_05120 [Pseudomonadota bacterium]